MAANNSLHKKIDLWLIQEVTEMQLCSLCFQSIQAVSFRSENADDRNAPAQKGPGKVQSQALANPCDKDWVTVHGLRNSARVWMFSLKQPPRAVVLVWEFVSITPRDLTQ